VQKEEQEPAFYSCPLIYIILETPDFKVGTTSVRGVVRLFGCPAKSTYYNLLGVSIYSEQIFSSVVGRAPSLFGIFKLTGLPYKCGQL
jgi:hypothetical protein